jgi:guanidinopropionase
VAGPQDWKRIRQEPRADGGGAWITFPPLTTRGLRFVAEATTSTSGASGTARCGAISGLQVFSDLGDAPVNPIDLHDTLARVEAFFAAMHARGIVPLAAGGDHLATLPVMRAIARDRPVGMVHFDAHTDTWDRYFGDAKYTHGTPFRRAIEEGLLDPRRTVQIGIRGALYRDAEDDWGERQGITIVDIDDMRRLGIDETIRRARAVAGDGPTYVSFDVDFLDPVYAPGTGTPEIGGATTWEAQQLVRGLRGLDLIGGDVVEVSPPFDQSGNTALVGATMMFEILCVLAQARQARRAP